MDIFESLENLNVSEECFEDIVNLVEAIIDEGIKDEVKNHQKWSGGGATFSYKGNNYSYFPDREVPLQKEGTTKDERGHVTKALDTANNKFEKARKGMYSAMRLYRNANKKLNKMSNGKVPYSDSAYNKLLGTIDTLYSKKKEAEDEFDKINKEQIKDGAPGIKYEDATLYHTKKGDNYRWRPIVRTNFPKSH